MNESSWLLLFLNVAILGALLYQFYRQQRKQQSLPSALKQEFALLKTQIEQFQQQEQAQKTQQQSQFHNFQQQVLEQTHQHQLTSLKQLKEHHFDNQTQFNKALGEQSELLHKRVLELNNLVAKKLTDISEEVDKRLTTGFEKTTQTFTDVIKRLALIDEAQKKITELSTNVISLQDLLNDKRSRGAFGEVQLNTLIKNMIPAKHVSFQHTLSNGKRADCILFLPEPTGNVVIDAKFPLESFRKMSELSASDPSRRLHEQQFRQDIKKHIQDIASKYIIPNETADGAMMFIPAEAIFAEIHANFPELVELAHRQKIWLSSPTTMMAILTTAKAVLKDSATRKQVHIIQEHLVMLSKDFSRFEKRMDNLSRHIKQAHDDVNDVQKSANKITSRFGKIEQVELSECEGEKGEEEELALMD